MGLTDDEQDERLAELLREMPTAFAAAPDTETESRHLAAITAAARDLAHQDHSEPDPALGAKWRNTLSRNRRMIVTAKLAASALAVCAASAGLAVAGVTLPDPASDVAKAIGLPNQADDKSDNAADIEGAEDVRQNSKPDTTSDGEGDDVSTESHGEGHGIGESVSDDAQQLGDAMSEADTPEERKAIAEEFSNSVKEQARDRSRLPEQAQSAPESGETQSQDGQSLGEEKADEHRPEDAGGGRP
jgi:hypothetical protein